MEKHDIELPASLPKEVVEVACQHHEVLQRVGQLTRTLHESLRGLGLDKLIQKTAHEIPNVRDRLNYVAQMSEQAAQRVLNATDDATPLQDRIEETASKLTKDWEKVMGETFSEAVYQSLARRTVTQLEDAGAAANETKQLLLEIMMAQDFQDLTGQVIKKITELAHNVESQLVQLLLDYAPQEMKRDTGAGLLNGPQINPNASPDVVSDQSQVDDLLDSLGF